MYIDDEGFSGHDLIKICLKLYSLLIQLSQQSESTTLLIEQRKLKLSNHFGERLDQDDRVYNKGKQVIMDSKDDKDYIIHEEDIFFMFILKISKKIEIAVHPPSLQKPITKIVYFPLEPETYFLDNNTKSELEDTVDLDCRRVDF